MSKEFPKDTEGGKALLKQAVANSAAEKGSKGQKEDSAWTRVMSKLPNWQAKATLGKPTVPEI